jgi:hypothetical protein
MSLLSQQRHYIYLRYRLTTLATVFLFAYVCCIHSVQADTSSKTAVNLGIINSFSGSTSFADTGALVYIDGTYYTCEQEIQISLFSDMTSSYILSGNDLINSVTGVEIGPYTEIVDITLA